MDRDEVISLDQYQRHADATAVYPGQGMSLGLAYVALGLCGEAGELANKVKKILRDSNGTVTTERREELLKELGDVLWYLAQTATELKASLGQVAFDNIQKLHDRKERGMLKGEGDQR